jgi:hypothetical protein
MGLRIGTVRVFTLLGLGDYGSEGVIPALQKIAQTSPDSSIKKSAADAIVKIQARARK